jgi:hypothetical protein
MHDEECAAYFQTPTFGKDITELLVHDQMEFDTPSAWTSKAISDSPIIENFPELWEALRSTYQNELKSLAFAEIPDEKLVANSFMNIIKQLKE